MNPSFYQSYFRVEREHWLMKVRRAIMRDQLQRYPAQRVLDFGCGSGVLVGELQQQQTEAFGVDMSQDAIAFGTEQGIRNLQTIQPGQPVPFEDASFDGVIAMDVLEHLKDEQPALEELFRVLRPGGFAYITVPAYMFLWGKQDEASHHYRRYTRSRVLDVIRAHEKFAIRRATYFNTFLFPAIALVRIGSRLFKRQQRESDFDLNNAIVNRIFFFIFDLERRLLRVVNYPFGVSILVILQKPTQEPS